MYERKNEFVRETAALTAIGTAVAFWGGAGTLVASIFINSSTMAKLGMGSTAVAAPAIFVGGLAVMGVYAGSKKLMEKVHEYQETQADKIRYSNEAEDGIWGKLKAKLSSQGNRTDAAHDALSATVQDSAFPKNLTVHIQSNHGADATKITKGVLSVMLSQAAHHIENGDRRFQIIDHGVLFMVGEAGTLKGIDKSKDAFQLDIATTTSAFGVHTPEWEAARILNDAADQVSLGDLSFDLKDLHGEHVGAMRYVPAEQAELNQSPVRAMSNDSPALNM